MFTNRLSYLLIVVVLLTACAPQAEMTLVPSTATMDTLEAIRIEGMFDVGGHKLYLHCEGSGSPTIIYLHGYSHNEGDAGAQGGANIQSQIQDRYRICIYDRRNVGQSDAVSGLYTGLEAVEDLHNLLDVAGVEPPYVLLGASYGGMISYLYAAKYPEDVVGMVLLDAAFPGELDLEALFPDDQKTTHEEFLVLDERLDQLAAYEEAQSLPVPEIPVTYLLATPSTWPQGIPEYDDVIHDRIRAYVESFSPGVVIEVESPHYMEAAVPDVIVEELEKVIEKASR